MSIILTLGFSLLLLIGLVVEAVRCWNDSWAKPALAVYGTAGVWYPANLLYSGIDHFRDLFPDSIINAALFQFCGFLILLRLFIPLACRWLVTKKVTWHSGVQILPFEKQIVPLFLAVVFLWLVLFIAGAVRLEGNILPVIWPPSAREKVALFVHSGIGGRTGFITAAAQYSYQLTCAFFGISFILGRGWVRIMAFLLICFTWPYFMFDRTRNVQLAILMPTMISYLLLGRSHPVVKAVMTAMGLIAIYVWFLLVGIYRSDYDMSRFLSVPRQSTKVLLESRHFGLDMLEELCFINTFIEKGTYKVNYGERYLGEFLNFVPRAIWKNKPLLGFDYAIARGFVASNASYRETAINTTIATGMIGQGVTNFGRVFGLVSAAALMALWVGCLARHWEGRWRIGNAFLFLLGMGLTFNLGRDITLLVLWPFVFASIGVWILDKITYKPVLQHAPRMPARRR
ncbi:hypothetical protein SAMN02745166_04364 [Prosthecobacter debontii]|uniref:Oligosaccharide repeat unit polymerase n=1 Tax=Prosthecobacter debontii TaxID=48467 RepID=A0A1T4YXC1_9BACT|nr:hypothetical protein [Prosthecobacter debontii]SKB05895.1 hypothetical protein SAMN02745166_04364 [Prosthecobacter debontii]